ncbi:hypothetical protein SERLA73DRAFT_183480 [Serpula lacrymans var. lacrymans S7.3]|uniref:Uncharacterized protein n=2 Tax=Serpula lacrymans var. lacrymans TaxID=341189 RepID=F8PZY6_SERL3|nr:uncharacterized protein SERLADRAFT_470683 [Serpula lacrymans var. lacrymans S7.9]EGN98458.1 hypothetical protein SERLA73DRAFT_183480 [Serpula lacrymans var. lacrymans S7.3]EGO24037.1 hypothetical protein SERLADRAFT_470683 [Serpula lacrymans var. lacrymans S7.9]
MRTFTSCTAQYQSRASSNELADAPVYRAGWEWHRDHGQLWEHEKCDKTCGRRPSSSLDGSSLRMARVLDTERT